MQRKTGQREVIKKAIEDADRPLAPAEILEISKETLPGIGIATIYRAIRDLVDAKWLTTVDIPGEPSRYELAAKPHHHHFHCRSCGRVFEVHGCSGHFQAMTPKGFLLEHHEVTLRGLCPECLGKAES